MRTVDIVISTLATLALLAIILGMLLARRYQRSRWNNGICADCGTPWEPYSSYAIDDGRPYQCGCPKEHRMAAGVMFQGDVPLHVSNVTKIRREINRLITPDRDEENLRLLFNARETVKLLDVDNREYDNLNASISTKAIVFTHQRGHQLIKFTIEPSKFTLVQTDTLTGAIQTSGLSPELIPYVFMPNGFEGVAMLNAGVGHVHV